MRALRDRDTAVSTARRCRLGIGGPPCGLVLRRRCISREAPRGCFRRSLAMARNSCRRAGLARGGHRSRHARAIRPWPWSRMLLAELIRVVSQAEPGAIGLDILLRRDANDGAGRDPGPSANGRSALAGTAEAKPPPMPLSPQLRALSQRSSPSSWMRTSPAMRCLALRFSARPATAARDLDCDIRDRAVAGDCRCRKGIWGCGVVA